MQLSPCMRVALATTIALWVSARAAAADRVIAIAPLSTLGAEDKSAATKKLTTALEQATAGLAATKVITAAQVSDAIAKAKKPALRACESDVGCLAELGKLVGATIVVSGEVGGLAESRVVYLGATDVATAKELRSTTLAIGGGNSGDDPTGPAGAIVRLIDPDKYNGLVRFTIDAPGATVFVNGAKKTLTGKGELELPVGTQAVRVTHPEYRDFVKFVDVGYGHTTEVAVGMTQYPIIEHDVTAKPTSLDKIQYVDPPMWRRWYVTGPAVIVVAVGVGVLVGALSHSFPSAQTCTKVGGGPC